MYTIALVLVALLVTFLAIDLALLLYGRHAARTLKRPVPGFVVQDGQTYYYASVADRRRALWQGHWAAMTAMFWWWAKPKLRRLNNWVFGYSRTQHYHIRFYEWIERA